MHTIVTLLKLAEILRIPVYACEPRNDYFTAGVIHDIDPAITMPQLCEQLKCNATIGQVRRLGATRTVRVTLGSWTLPNYALVGCVRHRVDPFTHRQAQCRKGRQFGHVLAACKRTETCT